MRSGPHSNDIITYQDRERQIGVGMYYVARKIITHPHQTGQVFGLDGDDFFRCALVVHDISTTNG